MWRGPSYPGEFPSLGWAVSDWITENLFVPDGPRAGRPLVLTDEQLGILVRFYRIHPRTGKPVYRRASVVRPKGWGKSPILAAVALAEACGPVRFSHWDTEGEPVGMPPATPWIQIAAVSEDQTDNTYRALYAMLGATSLDGDLAPIVASYGLDVGLTRINIPGGGLIEPVTASSGTREGQRVTFAVLDETHLWKPENHGDKLASTIRRNAAKMDGRTFESTNAWAPGESSVAESTADAARGGQEGVLFDHKKYPGEWSLTNKQSMRKALTYVYGESAGRGGWINIARLLAEISDPATTDEDNVRFYFNEENILADTWVHPKAWAALAAPVLPELGEEIALGFVGLLYQGAALIGCRMATGELFVVGGWETGEELVPRSDVHVVVAEVMESYVVRRFYVDPNQWATEYDSWHLAWGDTVISRPPQQTARMAYAVERFRSAVGGADLHHDGNPVLSLHVGRARTRKVAAGTLIVPRTDAPKDQITAAKAAVLAFEARSDVLALPPPEEEEAGELVTF